MSSTIPGWWSKGRAILWTVAVLLVAGSLYAAFARAPVEAQMGVVQKIVYIHVPSATVTLLAFGLTFAAGIAPPARRDDDRRDAHGPDPVDARVDRLFRGRVSGKAPARSHEESRGIGRRARGAAMIYAVAAYVLAAVIWGVYLVSLRARTARIAQRESGMRR